MSVTTGGRGVVSALAWVGEVVGCSSVEVWPLPVEGDGAPGLTGAGGTVAGVDGVVASPVVGGVSGSVGASCVGDVVAGAPVAPEVSVGEGTLSVVDPPVDGAVLEPPSAEVVSACAMPAPTMRAAPTPTVTAPALNQFGAGAPRWSARLRACLF
ncbi:MAG: hypothetical protein NTW76_14400 [Corynebacteriales bacterium]|nr:hypothetical protein [Mycobacteriales bacterium]